MHSDRWSNYSIIYEGADKCKNVVNGVRHINSKNKQESRAAARNRAMPQLFFSVLTAMLFHFLSSSYKKVPRPFFDPPP